MDPVVPFEKLPHASDSRALDVAPLIKSWIIFIMFSKDTQGTNVAYMYIYMCICIYLSIYIYICMEVSENWAYHFGGPIPGLHYFVIYTGVPLFMATTIYIYVYIYTYTGFRVVQGYYGNSG